MARVHNRERGRVSYYSIVSTTAVVAGHTKVNWGEPERAPHDVLNGDFVCLSLCPYRVYTYVHIPYIVVF